MTHNPVMITDLNGNVALAAGNEQTGSPSITSAGVYSSGNVIGTPVTILSGGVLIDLSISWNTSQTQNISAVLLRGALPTTSSTLKDHSAATIVGADYSAVLHGGILLTPTVAPGALVTTFNAGGINLVVSSGAQIIAIAGGTMNSAGAATSGFVIAAGIV